MRLVFLRLVITALVASLIAPAIGAVVDASAAYAGVPAVVTARAARLVKCLNAHGGGMRFRGRSFPVTAEDPFGRVPLDIEAWVPSPTQDLLAEKFPQMAFLVFSTHAQAVRQDASADNYNHWVVGTIAIFSRQLTSPSTLIPLSQKRIALSCSEGASR